MALAALALVSLCTVAVAVRKTARRTVLGLGIALRIVPRL